MRSRIDSAIPGPLSATEIVIAPEISLAVMSIMPPVAGAASQAFSSRLYNAHSNLRWSNHPANSGAHCTSMHRS